MRERHSSRLDSSPVTVSPKQFHNTVQFPRLKISFSAIPSFFHCTWSKERGRAGAAEARKRFRIVPLLMSQRSLILVFCKYVIRSPPPQCIVIHVNVCEHYTAVTLHQIGLLAQTKNPFLPTEMEGKLEERSCTVCQIFAIASAKIFFNVRVHLNTFSL